MTLPPSSQRKALRTSWKSTPMPATWATLPFEASYSPAEYGAICRGLVPGEMEDRWFVFEEDGTVYFHRSWTGACVYQVRFERADGGHRAVETVVNRDPKEHGGAPDPAAEARELRVLIDRLLLGR